MYSVRNNAGRFVDTRWFLAVANSFALRTSTIEVGSIFGGKHLIGSLIRGHKNSTQDVLPKSAIAFTDQISLFGLCEIPCWEVSREKENHGNYC